MTDPSQKIEEGDQPTPPPPPPPHAYMPPLPLPSPPLAAIMRTPLQTPPPLLPPPPPMPLLPYLMSPPPPLPLSLRTTIVVLPPRRHPARTTHALRRLIARDVCARCPLSCPHAPPARAACPGCLHDRSASADPPCAGHPAPAATCHPVPCRLPARPPPRLAAHARSPCIWLPHALPIRILPPRSRSRCHLRQRAPFCPRPSAVCIHLCIPQSHSNLGLAITVAPPPFEDSSIPMTSLDPNYFCWSSVQHTNNLRRHDRPGSRPTD